jgi:hypothetical protein
MFRIRKAIKRIRGAFFAFCSITDSIAREVWVQKSPTPVTIAPSRHITSHAGRALKILGHAIEYLTDEFVYETAPFSVNNSRMKAVQLLMALNREIYFECPETPSLAERCRAFLRMRFYLVGLAVTPPRRTPKERYDNADI